MAFGDKSLKDSGLNINVRPGSVDPIASQRTIFPLEAFEFDDPNRVAEPELRMKAPWKLVVGSIEINGVTGLIDTLDYIEAATNTAQGTADNAITDAGTAQGIANTAVTNAGNAQGTANTAITNAGTAQTTANTAIGHAEDALNVANSKNVIYRQASKPGTPPAKSGDLWYDSDDDNNVYLHNGTDFIRNIAIKSSDYVPGVSGWAIFQDGDVEFDQGEFRGTLAAESLQTALVNAEQITIAYAGADSEAPEVGDRRLIIRSEILTLESYNPDGDGASAEGWIQDISLGGFDSTGEFVDYIQASGITQDREDVSRIEKGLGLPPSSFSEQKGFFVNGIESKRVGEIAKGTTTSSWATPYLGKDLKLLTFTYRDLDRTKVLLPWPDLVSSGFDQLMFPIQSYNIFTSFLADVSEIASLANDYLIYSAMTRYNLYKGTEDIPADIIGSATLTQLLRVHYDTLEIYLEQRIIVWTYGYSSIEEIVTQDTGIYVTDGLNKFSLYSEFSFMPYFVVGNAYYRKIRYELSPKTLNVKNSDGIQSCSMNYFYKQHPNDLPNNPKCFRFEGITYATT